MHSKGHLRNRFLELLEDDDYLDIEEKQRSMMRICGKLWNSTDILPSGVRSELDELFEPFSDDYSQVGTYGQAARRMREILKMPDTERNKLIVPRAGQATLEG
jgi:hypothetical protein